MQEGVHVVGLVLGEDVHGDVLALRDAWVGEDLVGWVLIGGDGGV